jgi:hypothetical protein
VGQASSLPHAGRLETCPTKCVRFLSATFFSLLAITKVNILPPLRAPFPCAILPALAEKGLVFLPSLFAVASAGMSFAG